MGVGHHQAAWRHGERGSAVQHTVQLRHQKGDRVVVLGGDRAEVQRRQPLLRRPAPLELELQRRELGFVPARRGRLDFGAQRVGMPRQRVGKARVAGSRADAERVGRRFRLRHQARQLRHLERRLLVPEPVRGDRQRAESDHAADEHRLHPARLLAHRDGDPLVRRHVGTAGAA